MLQAVAVGINNKVNSAYTYNIDTIAGSGVDGYERLVAQGTNGTAVLDFGQTITVQGSSTDPAILRLHYSIELQDSDGAGDSLSTASNRNFRSCMIMFPAYSNDGSTWTCFPNRTNWFAFDGAGVEPGTPGPKRDNVTTQTDRYELPRNDGNTVGTIGANFDDGIVVITLDSFQDTGWRNAKHHGCLNFTNNSNLQLRYIGFFLLGPVMLSLSSIYGGGRSLAASGLGISPIRIERGNYCAMVFNPK